MAGYSWHKLTNILRPPSAVKVSLSSASAFPLSSLPPPFFAEEKFSPSLSLSLSLCRAFPSSPAAQGHHHHHHHRRRRPGGKPPAMKFGKSLSIQIEETLPEWREKFLSYKDLKKRLKLIDPKGGGGLGGDRPAKRPRLDEPPPPAPPPSSSSSSAGGAEPAPAGAGAGEGMTNEVVEFIRLLEDELEKFNSFFVEKEEEYIIKLKELQDRMAKAEDSNEEMIKIRKEIVDFHGEMVLLENYSALNYTGLVKILKKYDKRTGALIRLPFIQRVLQQPFFTTDMIYKLVKECEKMIDQLFPASEPSPPSAEAARMDDGGGLDPTTSTSIDTDTDGMLRVPTELAEIEHMKSLYMKSTISALRVLKEIRSGSSTVSVFSLPPLQLSGPEEAWKKVPLLEQEAK